MRNRFPTGMGFRGSLIRPHSRYAEVRDLPHGVVARGSTLIIGHGEKRSGQWRHHMVDPQLQARIDALRAMSPLPDEGSPQSTSALIVEYAALLGAIGQEVGTEFDPNVVDAVLHSFGMGDGSGTYWTAVHLIERSGNAAIYPLIRNAVVVGSPGMRVWGCILLSRNDSHEDLPLFLSCLHDAEPRVIYEALRGIRRIAEVYPAPEAIPAVERLIDHPRVDVARAAQAALAALRA